MTLSGDSLDTTPVRSFDRGPVLVLRNSYQKEWPVYDAAPGTIRDLFGKGCDPSGFLGHIAKRGYTALDVEVCGTTPRQFDFGRDTEWKSLPVVSNAKYLADSAAPFGGASIKPLDDTARERAAELEGRWPAEGGRETASAHVPSLIAVQLKGEDDLSAWRMVSRWLGPIASHAIPVILTDGTSVEEVAPGDVEARFAHCLAGDRFSHSHAANLGVMSERIVYAIAREENWTLLAAAHARNSLSWLSWHAHHPFCLQFLFAIRRLGLVVDDGNRMGTHHYDDRVLLGFARKLPFFERRDDGLEAYDLVWTGSGRYPAWRECIGELHPSWRFSPMEIGMAGHDVTWGLAQLNNGGYVAMGRDGSVGLTRFGMRFLDLVGDELEDADCLLRWRAPGASDVASMDRWLNRKFRHLKRRVAGLPSTLARDGGIPKDAGRIGGEFEALAYGREVPLLDEHLLDPAIMEALRGLDRATVAFQDSNSGLLFAVQRTRPDPRPRAFWVGVPLSMTKQGFWTKRRAYRMLDPSGLDAEVARRIGRLPEALARLCTGPSCIFSAGQDDGDGQAKAFVDLPCVIGDKRLHALSWIVEGRCLTHRPTDPEMPYRMINDFNIYGASTLSGWSFTPGIVGRGDHGGTRTVCLGYHFGVLDRASGRTWTQDLSDPAVAKARDLEMEDADHMGSLLALHPDITGHGFWVIHPDGTCEPFDAAEGSGPST
jgi:hypothetical protein